MEFRILGPLVVEHQGAEVPIRGRRLRALLAALLLETNRVVPLNRLIRSIWADESPAAAKAQVHGLISALRKTLGAAVVTHPSGYLLRVGDGQLDAHVFERLVGEADAAVREGDVAGAAENLRAALGLWRGSALAGIDGPVIESGAAHLDERRLATHEQCVELELRLGRHHELVGELRGLAADHPTRERPHAQLMLALYRSGRRAEALGVYREFRRVLIEELGLEPGAGLRALERAILSGDAILDADVAGAAPVPPAPERHVPAQLPHAISDFVGRVKQIQEVCDLLTRDDAAAMTAVMIFGRAGVGKTALAVEVAHRLRAAYPGGQLYVNLRGVHPDPPSPAEVLGRILRALGVDGPAIP
jgi:DNA-binding SARP family transcriptional activator